MHHPAIRTAAFALALAAIVGTASAGLNYGPSNVNVSTINRQANGGITLSRQSTDTVQYIDCHTMSYAGGATMGGCYARTKTNVSGTCSTQDPALIAAIRSITPSSYVAFTWDASGACAHVQVSNGSEYTL